MNDLSKLVDAFFIEIDKLNDPNLTGDKLTEQLQKTAATVNVGREIINTGRLVLDAKKAQADMLANDNSLPALLSAK